MHIAHKTRGFTIVELLVVIVVIAVLAAVTVSAYNGIQTRAINSKILSGVASWERVIKMYKAISGGLPLSSAGCLSNVSTDFPASSGLAAGECMHGFPFTPAFSEVYSSALITDIKTVLGTTATLPSGYFAPISGTIGAVTIYSQGIRYTSFNLMYYLKGGAADCGKGTLNAGGSSDSLTLCYFDLS